VERYIFELSEDPSFLSTFSRHRLGGVQIPSYCQYLEYYGTVHSSRACICTAVLVTPYLRSMFPTCRVLRERENRRLVSRYKSNTSLKSNSRIVSVSTTNAVS